MPGLQRAHDAGDGKEQLNILLIGLTIIVLFLGETTAFHISRLAVGSFLLGVGCFLLALLCFLAETVVATRLLNFHMLR